MRRRYGEVITDTSPLVREQFDRRDQFAIAHPKRVKESALACKLSELAEAVGLRTKVQLKEGQQPASIRSSIPRTNGFRRFYCGVLADAESSGLTTTKRWLLEGHRLLANDPSYLKTTTESLYQSFMLAHDNLLIDQSHKLQKRIEKMEIEKTEIQALALELEKVKRAMKLKTT